MSIEFFSQFNEKRPIRLCEETRMFALESLEGKYGREALEYSCVEVEIPQCGYSDSNIDRYDAAILSIAKNAPIRLCSSELLCGSATLGKAIEHVVPARFADDEIVIGSISHLTIDYSEVLDIGINGIRARAEKFALNCKPEKERFYQSVLTCLDAFEIYYNRYLDALANIPSKKEHYDILSSVPMNGACTSQYRKRIRFRISHSYRCRSESFQIIFKP